MPAGLLGQKPWRKTHDNFNPRSLPTFSLDHRSHAEGDFVFRFCQSSTDARSTGSKQTLNGLFYVYQPELFFGMLIQANEGEFH